MEYSGFIRKVLLFIIVMFVCVLLLFPFYWMFATSTFSLEDWLSYPIRILPRFNMNPYVAVIQGTDFVHWVLRSLLVAGVTVVSAISVACLGAYSLSRFRFRGRTVLGILLLVTQMIPPLLLMIPLYIIFNSIGLLDHLSGLIMGEFVFILPICIWMLKSMFDFIPVEIEEAARMDGCSRSQVLFKIVMPLSLPGITAVAIFGFLFCWDEFIFTRIVISSQSKWTATIGIMSFIGQWVVTWDQMMAAATMFTIPAIVLFLIIQKGFIAGLSGGGVKY